MSERIRVVVVDDHPIFRAGVVQALKSAKVFDVVGKGSDAMEAVKLAQELSPDVMLLDISLPGGGIEAAKEILREHPETRIVILTVSDLEENVATCLSFGVRGYILKGVGGRELTNGLQAVHNGETYVSPGLLARLFARKPNEIAGTEHSEELTPREREILALVSQGLTNQEIGVNLSLSVKTIKNHVYSIMRKLKVSNRKEAVKVSALH